MEEGKEQAAELEETIAEGQKEEMPAKRRPLIVNFYAGPSAGKTTAALELSSALSKAGYNVQYVPEYAKDLVLEGRLDELEDQEKVTDEQYHRLDRLRGAVDIVVTDSPVLLGAIYGEGKISEEYKKKLFEYYESFENFNLFVKRGDKFQKEGRIHNLEESVAIDGKILALLRENKIFYGNYYHDDIQKTVERIDTTYARLYGKPRPPVFDAEAVFSEQVDMVLSGADTTSTHIKVTDTPKILRDVGMPDLPVLITAKHLKSITQESGKERMNYHGISVKSIKKLPELLADPVMIMDSMTRDDSIVVLTKIADKENRPIIGAVKMNGYGNIEGFKIDANILTSVYGRSGFTSFIQRNIEAGNVLYWSKEKSQVLAEIPGIQFPDSLSNLSSDTIIRKSWAFVKGEEEKSFKNPEKDGETPETGEESPQRSGEPSQQEESGDQGKTRKTLEKQGSGEAREDEPQIDYSKLDKITATTQAELDAIPDDYQGHIYIQGGTPAKRIIVKKRYPNPVMALGRSHIEAKGNSHIEAKGNSHIEANGLSTVVAWDSSDVVAYGNSRVEAHDKSGVEADDDTTVEAFRESRVIAWGNSNVEARDGSLVIARGKSTIKAFNNSHVNALENSFVAAYEKSTVNAMGNSHVEAREHSHVLAFDNSHVEALGGSTVKAHDSARVEFHVEANDNAHVEASGLDSAKEERSDVMPQRSEEPLPTEEESETAKRDRELLERIKKSKRGEEFEKLYSGEHAAAERLRDDYKMAGILAFFSGGDIEQTVRIMRGSGANQADKPDCYYVQTAKKAAASCPYFYGQSPQDLEKTCFSKENQGSRDDGSNGR